MRIVRIESKTTYSVGLSHNGFKSFGFNGYGFSSYNTNGSTASRDVKCLVKITVGDIMHRAFPNSKNRNKSKYRTVIDTSRIKKDAPGSDKESSVEAEKSEGRSRASSEIQPRTSYTSSDTNGSSRTQSTEQTSIESQPHVGRSSGISRHGMGPSYMVPGHGMARSSMIPHPGMGRSSMISHPGMGRSETSELNHLLSERLDIMQNSYYSLQHKNEQMRQTADRLQHKNEELLREKKETQRALIRSEEANKFLQLQAASKGPTQPNVTVLNSLASTGASATAQQKSETEVKSLLKDTIFTPHNIKVGGTVLLAQQAFKHGTRKLGDVIAESIGRKSTNSPALLSSEAAQLRLQQDQLRFMQEQTHAQMKLRQDQAQAQIRLQQDQVQAQAEAQIHLQHEQLQLQKTPMRLQQTQLESLAPMWNSTVSILNTNPWIAWVFFGFIFSGWIVEAAFDRMKTMHRAFKKLFANDNNNK